MESNVSEMIRPTLLDTQQAASQATGTAGSTEASTTSPAMFIPQELSLRAMI